MWSAAYFSVDTYVDNVDGPPNGEIIDVSRICPNPVLASPSPLSLYQGTQGRYTPHGKEMTDWRETVNT